MMAPSSADMRTIDNADALKEALHSGDIKSLSEKIQALEKDGFTAKFQTGQEVSISNCVFKIENILAGKPGRLVLVAIPN